MFALASMILAANATKAAYENMEATKAAAAVKPIVVERYQELPQYIQESFPTVVSAINAGLIETSDTPIWEKVTLLINTGMKKHTQFTIDVNNPEWYKRLTQRIAKLKSWYDVDVTYKSQPINFMPIQELMTLASSKGVRFDIRELNGIRPSYDEPVHMYVVKDNVKDDEWTEETLIIRFKDVLMHVAQHPEDNYAIWHEWYKGLADREDVLQVFAKYLLSNPSDYEFFKSVAGPSFTPLVEKMVERLREAARVTAETSRTDASRETLLSTFSRALNRNMSALSDFFIGGKHSSSSSSHKKDKKKKKKKRDHNKRLKPRKRLQKYKRENYKELSIGEAYAISQHNNAAAQTALVGTRVYVDKSDDVEGGVLPRGSKVTSGNRINVELNPMISSSLGFVSRVANSIKGMGAHALVGIFAYDNTTRKADYHSCYFLQYLTRKDRDYVYTDPFVVPTFPRLQTLRVVVWHERRVFGSDRVYLGSWNLTKADVPPFDYAFDFDVLHNPELEFKASPKVDVFQNNPRLGVFPVKAEYTTNSEALEGRMNYVVKNVKEELGRAYAQPVRPHPFQQVYAEVAKPLVFEETQEHPLNKMYDEVTRLLTFDEEGIPQSPNKPLPTASRITQPPLPAQKVGQRLFTDKLMTVPDVVELIDIAAKDDKEVTAAMRNSLLAIFQTIFNSKGRFYLPLLVGSYTDSLDRRRDATEFRQKGLLTFGIKGFSYDKHGLHLYNDKEDHTVPAFWLWLRDPSTLLEAIRVRYPDFEPIKSENLKALSEYTGDTQPIDKPHEDDARLLDFAINPIMKMEEKVVEDLTKLGKAAVKSFSPTPSAPPLPSPNEEVKYLDDDLFEFDQPEPVTEKPKVTPPPLPYRRPLNDLQKGVEDLTAEGKEALSMMYTTVSQTAAKALNIVAGTVLVPPETAVVASSVNTRRSQRRVGSKQTKHPSKVATLDVMDLFNEIKPSFADDRELFYQALQIFVTHKSLVVTQQVFCQYKVITDLRDLEYPGLVFVEESSHRLAYQPGKVYIITGRFDDLHQVLRSLIRKDINLLLTAYQGAMAGKELPLVPMDDLIEHEVREDTDFAVHLGTSIKQINVSVGNDKVIQIPASSSTSLGDVQTKVGGKFDSFKAVRGDQLVSVKGSDTKISDIVGNQEQVKLIATSTKPAAITFQIFLDGAAAPTKVFSQIRDISFDQLIYTVSSRLGIPAAHLELSLHPDFLSTFDAAVKQEVMGDKDSDVLKLYARRSERVKQVDAKAGYEASIKAVNQIIPYLESSDIFQDDEKLVIEVLKDVRAGEKQFEVGEFLSRFVSELQVTEAGFELVPIDDERPREHVLFNEAAGTLTYPQSGATHRLERIAIPDRFKFSCYLLFN